ncbi:UDP-2,3-diacylglucosamine diphosphatase [Bordetella holmesii]|uniref:Calcineurin-like phosphoesterase family protein n=2 Tax=Bordetella holmesii TaxID=35814 RepID=A0A158M4A5_9BORD|nr:UDP-2,3-diacylglucosamine diphosphatase [Bordetella holmesii]AHV91508.1 calcineurin-like phosphoesterase family protein [Bordetella holmesii ATCC 51541]AIT27018.1 calcineurin-like phosphoesterase family protein [Bordetella holmesii 44057]EWM42811.1 calcineurin-like phosphoesterase family protein [Bordetella holmesii 41130]EWM47603.1 calcineurin-like phosphoesterase family protein [Bordetella holmesii 35009]EWM51769.1 calcineurin-like phosphoesterase family protein [Bordetella holmesii 70147
MNEIRPTHWRTLWISDVHLGSAGCKADFLLDFLEHNDCDTLYLVGDIVDGWQLRKHWHWPRAHNDVVQRILRKARNGTRVIFVPGNHDEFAREFVGFAFGDIEILDEDVHTTANGRRLLVLHGDQFYGVIQHSKWLAHLGDNLYQTALWLNSHFNRLRHRMGLHYWSLSQYLKHKVKNAVAFIDDFEQTLASEARRRGLDGVICGHIHKPAMRDVDGILYCNDGDWVESLSALAEDHDGELRLLDWASQLAERPAAAAPRRSLSLPALPSTLRRQGPPP